MPHDNGIDTQYIKNNLTKKDDTRNLFSLQKNVWPSGAIFFVLLQFHTEDETINQFFLKINGIGIDEVQGCLQHTL